MSVWEYVLTILHKSSVTRLWIHIVSVVGNKHDIGYALTNPPGYVLISVILHFVLESFLSSFLFLSQFLPYGDMMESSN